MSTELFYILISILLFILTLTIIYSIYKKKKYIKIACDIQNKYRRSFLSFCESNNINISNGVKHLSRKNLKDIVKVDETTWGKEEYILIKKEKEKKENERLYNEIMTLYPNGIELWLKNNPQSTIESAILAKNRIEEYEKDCQDKIKRKDQKDKQTEYTNECRDIAYTSFENLLYVTRYITLEERYEVLQLYIYSFCGDDSLDYSLCEVFRNNYEYIYNKYLEIDEKEAKTINAFIQSLYSKENVSIIISSINKKDDKGINRNSIARYRTLLDCLKEYIPIANIYYTTDYKNDDKLEEWLKGHNNRIIIIDLYTERDEMESLCKQLLSSKYYPRIAYISLMRGFTTNEMKIKIRKIEEQKRKEEEQKRKQMELEEKKKRAQQQSLTRVQDWNDTIYNLRYTYLVNYYPTTCEFEATEDEWENRWLIWNFKNTPGKTSEIQHKNALETVIPLIQRKLEETFGTSILKYMTLVCIPASTKQKTELRYKEFSNKICELTGMENSYAYITVEKDGGATHLRESGDAVYNYDENFFKGKYVILFDDVITKGRSMIKMKSKMEDMGATVVGGITIGKTKHQR